VEALIEEARRRARRRRLFCAAVVALAALVAVTVFVVFDRAAQSQAVSPSTAPPALAADATTSKIAFTREPLLSGYGGVLYVMNSDGSGKRRVSIGWPDTECAGRRMARRSPTRIRTSSS
jgi:hypothetical protein